MPYPSVASGRVVSLACKEKAVERLGECRRAQMRWRVLRTPSEEVWDVVLPQTSGQSLRGIFLGNPTVGFIKIYLEKGYRDNVPIYHIQ